MGGFLDGLKAVYDAEQNLSRKVTWGDWAHQLGKEARGFGNFLENGALTIGDIQGYQEGTPNSNLFGRPYGTKDIQAMQAHDALLKAVHASLAHPRILKFTTLPGEKPVSALPGGAPSATGGNANGGGGGTGGGKGSGSGDGRKTAAAPPATTPPATGPTFDFAAYLHNLTAGIPKQAHTLALADVNSRVNAIKAWQEVLMRQAHTRANQIGLASKAAASLLTPIAGQTEAAYRNAAKDQVAFASGFQGLLGNTATSEAQKVAHDLAAIDAPANTRTVNGIDLATQPQGLGNVLYSLGGALPASTLEQSGLANAGYQRQLPAAQIGAGKAESLAALGAGSKAANDLMPQILSAQGELPHIASQYISSLTSTANQQALAPALLAGKFNALPGNNPITGGKTATEIRLEQADRRLNQAAVKLGHDNTRLKISVAGLKTSHDRFLATRAYQQGMLALAAARVKVSALKKTSLDTAKASSLALKLYNGYNIGSGANTRQVAANTSYESIYAQVQAAYQNLPSKAVAAIVSSLGLAPAPPPYTA